jgi:hypothetical protein
MWTTRRRETTPAREVVRATVVYCGIFENVYVSTFVLLNVRNALRSQGERDKTTGLWLGGMLA